MDSLLVNFALHGAIPHVNADSINGFCIKFTPYT
jgi:hypothetical protein